MSHKPAARHTAVRRSPLMAWVRRLRIGAALTLLAVQPGCMCGCRHPSPDSARLACRESKAVETVAARDRKCVHE